MNTETTIELGLLLAVLAGVVTLYNVFTSRGIKKLTEGRWQGSVDIKLDNIINTFTGLSKDVALIKDDINALHTRVSLLEGSTERRKRKVKETVE